MLGRVDDAGHRKVHQRAFGPVEYLCRHLLAGPPRHEAAAPDLAANQPMTFQFLVCVRDRLDADSQRLAELALRRQTRARVQRTLLDIVRNRLRERL